MALQNRVTPLGDIVATPRRGTLMGNRGGRIHDPATQKLLKRRFASKQWICCVLSFKNRRRRVMGPGYTELFFMDEVTALAAGHRPCFECRRAAATTFAQAFARGNDLHPQVRAPHMDTVLHAERLDGQVKRLHLMPERLPDGAMIVCDGQSYVRHNGHWLHWTPECYSPAAPDVKAARLVTPPSIVATLIAGYRPHWHESAQWSDIANTVPAPFQPH